MLQTYQAYRDSHTPPREVNAHIIFHVAQTSQPKHGSLVDSQQKIMKSTLFKLVPDAL